jgi:ubiquinone biosynthesis UbiH/UbiF/VisC/COQ6 family hydroxylase
LSVVWIVGDGDAKAVERESVVPAPADRDPRVYALSPSTQRFLERLRVWPQLDAACMAPVLDMRVFGDRNGRSALHFDAYQAATERLATIVEHRELARVLLQAAAFFPGIERIEGSASQTVADTDRVSITTSAGARSARLVIAADGPRSPTRTALGIATQGSPYAQRALIGNFASTRPHGGTAAQWFTDEGVIALLPLAPSGAHPHAVSLVWSAPDTLAERLLHEGPDAVEARLSALTASHASTSGALTAIGSLSAIPLSVQWAASFIAPRAVLVGDAAHVIHPLAGQGLNLGFGDVEALIDILAAREAFRDVGDRVLLRRYERSRAGPVRAMRTMTDGLVRLFAGERRAIAPLRGLGMRLLDRADPLKRLLVRQAAGESPFV